MPVVIKEVSSKINIREAGKGYLIEIDDGIMNPVFAVTEDELRQIVLFGSGVLKSN